VIVEQAPGSLDELARITGKAKSNLSRTLRTMAGYGLVRLERGERGRITPKVTHDRVELDLPLTVSRRSGGPSTMSPFQTRSGSARRTASLAAISLSRPTSNLACPPPTTAAPKSNA
jgi:hypothetical protein